MQAISTPGHTPGHTSYMLSSSGRESFVYRRYRPYTLPVQASPEWALSFDIDPIAGSATRKRVMDMAASEKLPVIIYHLPFPGIGHVARDGDAFRFVASPMEL